MSDLLPLPPLAFPIVAALFGLTIGSFANVCIYRLPRGKSIVTPRSACPSCGKPISGWDNVPVLSYLILLGRCRQCRAPIAARYPLVEAINGALYFAVAAVLGPTPDALLKMAFVTALLVLALIDLEHQILPNVITRPGIAAGLLASFVLPPPTPVEAFAAAAAGYVAFMAIAKTWEHLRGIEALGQGDWKLAAMLGAFLGWQKLLFTVFAAALCGTIVGLVVILIKGRNLQYRLPLGTFLGFAGIAAIFVGEPVVRWYGHFLRN
jgi:leader peptidase (prepilin peptidase)/N-methyltransferase